MTDNDILKYCFNDKHNITHNKIIQNKVMNMSDDMKEYLLKRFDDSDSLYESIYRIKNNIINRPTCIICGNHVKYLRSGKYAKCCSKKCVGKHSINNMEKKYGIKSSLLLKSSKEKTKRTLIEKYNVDNISKSKDIKNKKKETFISHYGYENNFCNKDILNKAKINSHTNKSTKKRQQTCLEKYGYKNYLSTLKGEKLSNERKQQISEIVSSKEFQDKRNKSLSIHKTWNTSKYEEKVYSELQKYIDNTDIIRQYKSIEYPFNCDFYIKPLNIYIEVQCSHYHHFKPFNYIEDKYELERLYKKSKDHPQYKSIIETWTIRDIKKRNVANKNKLNYIEIWPSDNIEEKIKNIFIK